ncbi:PKS4 [Sordaria macrospora]|uniref:PKS4 n=3 Tax=Sordaria macrospora TaxID=5147 RepID=A0A8S8ZR52_SORMA|nr:uncharacterized protein SMAC_05695 [Sordaria macrospora k-hell]KAA8632513.1 PKS4 [Sordaria macrospora]WPJ65499.1 hypothetical protein SMAC4_05695 [Sordaria macrospora]CCC12736.1 putative polyketide synthase [Sordaria macrospora k-hell]
MSYKIPLSEPIAIVGSGCRFTGEATSPAKLWELLKHPKDLTREVPKERFNVDGFYHPDGEYHGTTNSAKAYFLEQDHRLFDASFFNITPKEAEAIDPQQRMLLEVVYEALESAGYSLQDYSGKKVAVFAGVMTADYDTLSQRDDLSVSQYYATGNARSIISNRVSYFFNFHGPSMTIDTACSSSLVALHQAVLSLRSGEAEMACVSGVNLILTPEQFVVESSLHMLSPTGRCHMWDDRADGYARGEGVAAMFIKPLSKALADGDRIEAIIRETGVNSDGRSQGITMPNWEAQSTLIQDTYRRSGLNAKDPLDRCQFFEAHGTGTAAGDPNEARAIEDAFFGRNVSTAGQDTAEVSKLLVGSVKTVIGHTEGAAGLAGLFKVVHAMNNGTVPPNLHFNRLQPAVAKYYSHLHVPTKAMAWPSVPAGQPRRATVNSFGFGGTNSTAICEMYVPDIHDPVAKIFAPTLAVPKLIDSGSLSTDGQIRLPLVLSASSPRSLGAVAKCYRDFLLQYASLPLEQAAWYAYKHRTAFPYRTAVTGSTMDDIMKGLDALITKADAGKAATISVRARPQADIPKILGIFTGQGAQWATMSRGLLETSNVYAQSIRKLDDVLQACPHPPAWFLEQEIMADASLSRVGKAAISQPLCTAVQIALIDLLAHLGITFHTVVGHSSGEIAAAYAAGKLSARDSILISYYRGKYAHLASGAEGQLGGMMAAGLTKAEAEELCAMPEFGNRVCVAASNGPSSVTLSGDLDIVQKVRDHLVSEKKFARMLQVDTAYHSPHMVRPATEYIEALKACNIAPLQDGNGITWVSSVYGHGDPTAQELASSYWHDNMVNAVLFFEAVSTALEGQGPFDCAIEVGPHAALRGPVTQTMKANSGEAIIYSGLLDRKLDDRIAFADFLGWMWSNFASSSAMIQKFVQDSVMPELIQLRFEQGPNYPWDHSHTYYRESRVSRQYHFRTHKPHELLGIRTRDDNEHELRWRNIMKYAKLPWAQGHKFQGQALLPASAYCIMVLDAARVLLGDRAASVVELRDLRFMAGITLEPESPGVETLFSLVVSNSTKDASTIEATFTLTSAPADGIIDMKLNFSGKLHILLGEKSPRALTHRPAQRAETLSAQPEAFYKMMAGTGLDYQGPFKGLTAIERRYKFSSGNVKRFHADDETDLDISPATLDSCLQTAFLTVSSPGDGSLWTSFLPKVMSRVKFNLATCHSGARDDELAVDAYLTQGTPFSKTAAASFTAEINIYNPNSDLEIQIEGLTVGSFTSTRPENDRELYLTTIYELDPEDQIVSSPPEAINGVSPMLFESCARVASSYVERAALERFRETPRDLLEPAGYQTETRLVSNSWPRETEKSLEKFIRSSPYFMTLDFIRHLGENLPDVLPGMLPTLVQEAQQLSYFQKQVGRVVRQIVHKYPRMNILGLTDPEMGLTEHIMAALEGSFLSYRIGGKPEANLKERTPLFEGIRKKIMVDEVDLEGEVESAGGPYDLVVLNTSILENKKTHSALQLIRDSMRPGGFLIVLHASRTPLKDRMLRCAGRPSAHDGTTTPPDWPDLIEECGFENTARNSDTWFNPGFTLSVRQAKSRRKKQLLRPLHHATTTPLVEHVLIVGGKKVWTSCISSGVLQELALFCEKITAVDSFEDIQNDELLSSCTAAIILGDIDQPILADMTAERMNTIRSLLHPQMLIMWVTHNARFTNPDHAASLGFTRTVTGEVPGLHIQVLDLDTIDTRPAVRAVSETFARFIVHFLGEKNEDDEPLWIREHEVHLERGRLIVPRVLPWKEGNQRVNAPRRVVTDTVNTLEDVVEVFRSTSGRYETRVERSSFYPSLAESAMHVDYSTVNMFKVGGLCSGYVSIGRNNQTGQAQVALCKSNKSYISTASTLFSTLPEGTLGVCEPLYLGLLSRYLYALTVANLAGGRAVMIIEPDRLLFECAKDVFSNRGIMFVGASTDERRSQTVPGMTFVHTQSTARQIEALYPIDGACIVNMLPKSHDISRMLVDSMPENCFYFTQGDFVSAHFTARPIGELTQKLWEEGVALSYNSMKKMLFDVKELSLDMQNPIALPKLLDSAVSEEAFQMLDWKAERSIAHMVKPTVGEKMLRANRTYVLVGITRDMGQSLCSLFIEQGARHLVLCSRNPPKEQPQWQKELNARGIKVKFEAMDVTNLNTVIAFKAKLAKDAWPPVGGVVNGAMVLDDRVFSEMSVETWNRVMNPKVVGSKNLDEVFNSPDMDFFIMTSSFAAIGGHAGQSNYAAANMFMNGIAASRRCRGLPATALNIGVVYGLGFLHREKDDLYAGLEREGYPPISERDLHHMFLEAIAAGKPVGDQVYDITTGMNRFRMDAPNQHWQLDPRFSHNTLPVEDETAAGSAGQQIKSLSEDLEAATTKEDVMKVYIPAFIGRLEALLQIVEGEITPANSVTELGVDSLVAVEIRSWIWKSVAQDVAVMKILSATSIAQLCEGIAADLLATRDAAAKKSAATEQKKEIPTGASKTSEADGSLLKLAPSTTPSLQASISTLTESTVVSIVSTATVVSTASTATSIGDDTDEDRALSGSWEDVGKKESSIFL